MNQTQLWLEGAHGSLMRSKEKEKEIIQDPAAQFLPPAALPTPLPRLSRTVYSVSFPVFVLLPREANCHT